MKINPPRTSSTDVTDSSTLTINPSQCITSLTHGDSALYQWVNLLRYSSPRTILKFTKLTFIMELPCNLATLNSRPSVAVADSEELVADLEELEHQEEQELLE